MRQILSIDGGGVRGTLVACFLVELEKRTGKLCREYFDMAAGTSTGADIAVAIAAGMPATEILQLYQQDCPKLFNLSPLASWAKRLIRGYAYTSSSHQALLQKRLHPTGQWTLNDSPIRLLLTAMDMSGHSWYFVQDRPRNSKRTGALPIIDCAVGSAAAPTYFDAWKVPTVGYCFDGGTGVCGNPVHQAVIEAFRYDDFDPASTRVLSLGTGYVPDTQAAPPSGLLNTLEWTLDTLLDAPLDEQSRLVDWYYPGIMQRYNWLLPYSIDMADATKIPALVELGQRVMPAMNWDVILKKLDGD